MIILLRRWGDKGLIGIRTANPDDAAAIIAGINAICDEGDAFYISRFVATPEWHSLLYQPESTPNSLLLVAEWHGQFAGSGNLFAGASHTYYQHVGTIGLFVLKPFRGLGIGKSILEDLLKRSCSMGLEKITLVVFADNWKAIRLYQQYGFIVEGNQKNHIKMGAIYRDLILMARFCDNLWQEQG